MICFKKQKCEENMEFGSFSLSFGKLDAIAEDNGGWIQLLQNYVDEISTSELLRIQKC